MAVILGALALAVATPAAADECAGAQALVAKAIDHYQKVGRDKAFADFMTREWMNGELYVVVATMDGIFKVHPVNPRLMNNPQVPLLRDSAGVSIIQEMIRAGSDTPQGAWAGYTWVHPETRRPALKQTWVKQHDGQLFMVGCYS